MNLWPSANTESQVQLIQKALVVQWLEPQIYHWKSAHAKPGLKESCETQEMRQGSQFKVSTEGLSSKIDMLIWSPIQTLKDLDNT